MKPKESPIWRPYTQHGAAPPPVKLARAEGAILYAEDGRRYIDGIASWWVNIHGHCHPKIVRAVQEQAAQLEQAVFASFTHEPAERLAREVLALAGTPLEYAFFSDSGSTTVEVALKMAIGYWAHRGEKRHVIVALEHGYHGDTFGAMAAGARSVFNRHYEPYLFQVERLPFPAPGAAQETLDAFEHLARTGQVAALILEPLILGAGGMFIYEASCLAALAEICRRHDILLIADEVMTGWGRAGTMFACQQAGVRPDIMCLAKGLTNGFLPLGLTLASARIFEAFYHQDRARAFYHSSSFAGNALACAAAVASLEIWREEPVFERIARVAVRHQEAVKRFMAHPCASGARSLGTIFAVDVGDASQGYEGAHAAFLYRFFMERGVFLRPLGNTVYVMPPYCIEDHDLEIIYDAIDGALDSLRDGGARRRA